MSMIAEVLSVGCGQTSYAEVSHCEYLYCNEDSPRLMWRRLQTPEYTVMSLSTSRHLVSGIVVALRVDESQSSEWQGMWAHHRLDAFLESNPLSPQSADTPRPNNDQIGQCRDLIYWIVGIRVFH